MDMLAAQTTPPPLTASPRPPKIWKFWGTTLWGLFIIAAMFAGQLVVVGWFAFLQKDELGIRAAIHAAAASGPTLPLSVIMGLPAVAAACWVATRTSRTPFADYLGLRGTSWKNVALGIVALIVLVGCWDLLSRAMGREVTPGFMGDVLKSAQASGALWLLVIAFCVAAPVSEELFARGFLFRGWSETQLGVTGAIVLSSLAWTALHLQYDWFGFAEVFSIGLLFGYLRYRTGSLWLTILLHGLNNLAATLQTMFLTS